MWFERAGRISLLFVVMLVTAVVALGGCRRKPPTGPTMMPGQDCIGCHARDPRAPMFSAAGTVYVDHAGTRPAMGARVTVTDSANRSVTMVANEVGNFFTTERLEYPVRASIEYEGAVREMATPQPTGACNYCHRTPPRRGAPGRISATMPGGQGSSR